MSTDACELRMPIALTTVMGQIRSFGDVGSMSGLPESGHGSATCENTPWHIGMSPRFRSRGGSQVQPEAAGRAGRLAIALEMLNLCELNNGR